MRAHRHRRDVVTAAVMADEGRELRDLARQMSEETSDLVHHLDETGDPAHIVNYLADVREAIGHLKDLDAALVRAMGRRARDEGYEWAGESGPYDWAVHGGTARKAWDHERWQHDVRARIVERFELSTSPVIVDTTTGEVVTLHALLIAAQAVHGSAAPKTTSGLKPLGLDPEDYCETSDGPFTLTIEPRFREDTPDD